jgi:glycosyltransferase involved in cell wall biosynthesis
MSTRFSIVIPSYMQARWLEPCIKSVLGQRGPGVEVETLVMDGGSTDGSRAIIERYAPELAYWQSEKDGGQAAAIRAGFGRAKGEIFGWLNSDDLLMPGALAKVASFFETQPDEEVVTGGGFYIDAAGKAYFWHLLNQNHTFGVAASQRRFLYFKPQQGIWQPATFWRRQAYEAVGGVDPQFHYIMDFDLFTRLSGRRRFARLKEMLACFRIHEENKTHAMLDVYRREIKVWEAKYGMDKAAFCKKFLIYNGYRFPAYARKAWAILAERTGLLNFEAPSW